LPDLDDKFIRDDYDEIQLLNVDVTTTKTKIELNIGTIQFLLVKRTGTAANITIYTTLSANGITVDEYFLAYDLQGVTVLYLESSAATTVKLIIAGT